MAKSPVKKVLFTSHTANFHKFNRPFMRMLRGTLERPYQKYNVSGWEVHYASADEESILDCDQSFRIDFVRSPFRLDRHIKSYRQLKKILKDNRYDIVHTHTPVGSIVTRLAARSSRKLNGTRVIYTNHGAHFLKGGPLLGWLLWFPVERYCSRFTDEIVVINREDYERFSKYMHCKVTYLDGGVGVDKGKFATKKMSSGEKEEKRSTLGLSVDDCIIIYIAELIPRKNHQMAIQAMRKVTEMDDSFHLLVVGADSMNGKLQRMANKYNLSENIHFLGYRKDVSELCQIADIAITTSRQEGFGLGVAEAIASGLPVVATHIRGHTEFDDLVSLVRLDDSQALAQEIGRTRNDRDRKVTKLPPKFYLESALKFHERLYK